MKKKAFEIQKILCGRLILLLGICSLAIQPAIAGSPVDSLQKVTSCNIFIKKLSKQRKSRVHIHPDITRKKILFTASRKSDKQYQLFLFSMDGKLVKQTGKITRETAMVPGMEKGNYLFEVFSDDQRVENGSIDIR